MNQKSRVLSKGINSEIFKNNSYTKLKNEIDKFNYANLIKK